MKSIWSIVSFLAVVHLLAILLFVGWLFQSGRVDRSRLDEVRSLFAVSVADEEAQRAEAEHNAAIEAAAAEEERRENNPFPPSAEQVSFVTRIEQNERDRARRTEAEMDSLREQLDLAGEALAHERTALAEERAAWEREREELASRTSDAQFSAVVKILETLPPKQVKDTFIALATDGLVEQAVLYLNSMKSYNASEVLAQFKTESEKIVATDLLERLRALGSTTGAAGTAPDADAASQSD